MINQCILNKGVLASGGDDTKVRLFVMDKKEYKEVGKTFTYEGPTAAVTGVDLNSNNSRVVGSSKDHNAYIWDVKSAQILDKVCFKYKPDMKNMVMRDCLFNQDDALYTLAVEPRQPTYVVKWTPEGTKYTKKAPIASMVNPKNASTGMRLSHDESKLSVVTSDGFANLVHADSLKQCLAPKKLHNMVVTGCAFHPRTNMLVTASTDYSYCFTSLNDFSYMKFVQRMVMRFSLLFSAARSP